MTDDFVEPVYRLADFSPFRCEWSHSAVGRCKRAATHRYIRLDWPNRPAVDIANVCDDHKMGDGAEGRKDWGWQEIAEALAE